MWYLIRGIEEVVVKEEEKPVVKIHESANVMFKLVPVLSHVNVTL
jgi:hypothetical protein